MRDVRQRLAAAPATLLLMLGLFPACKSGSGSGADAAGSPGAGGAAGDDAGHSGTAGTTGAGGAGTAGSVAASGGSAGTACGAPAHTYPFSKEKIRNTSLNVISAGLAIQNDGSPLFIARDRDQREVMASHRPEISDGGVTLDVSYQISRPHPGGFVGTLPSVRLTHSGGIRFAYAENFNGNQTRYVEWNGHFNQDPTDVIVDPQNQNAAGPVTLALDSQDNPAVAYPLPDLSIRYAHRTGTSWTYETVAIHRNPLELALAFDGADGTTVFFTENPDLALIPDLFVTSRGSSGWSAFAPLDPVDMTGNLLAAGHDSGGKINLFYIGDTGRRRALGDAGSWNVQASQPNLRLAESGSAAAVVYGSHGEIHVVFDDVADGLTYAYYDGCGWTTQIVDSSGFFTDPAQPMLALDASGAPHITYQLSIRTSDTSNPSSYDLWYAHP